MTTRRAVLVSLVAALMVANAAWLVASRLPNAQPSALQSPAIPDKPYGNPFPTAHEVRLFVEVDYRDGNPVYSQPKGRALTATQRVTFESALAVHTIAPDEMLVGCFIPHHFFRYFDKAGKQVGEVQVCFCCAGVQQSDGSSVRLAEGQMLTADFGRLHTLITSMGERTDVQCEGEN